MKKVIISVVVLILLGVVYYLYWTPNSYLIANSVVPVYQTEKDAMTTPAPVPILTLRPGQRVEVTKFIDVKHYQIYEIRDPKGQRGYVLEGEYRLERNSKP